MASDQCQTPAGQRDSFSRAATVWVALVLIAVSGVAIWRQWPEAVGSHEVIRFPRSGGHEFDLSNSRVPVDRILNGGPPKDGIPAISSPRFLPPDEADYLLESDRVIGVVWGGQARAYPLRILNFHEVVNDRLGGIPLAVTYCPLCDSSAVFRRDVAGLEIEFGVSGLLFNSNVLLYGRDRDQSEMLWSQMASRRVTGPGSGEELTLLPLEVTTWADWRNRHPDTGVLSTETGYKRNYTRSSYDAYFHSDRLVFPVDPLDDRLSLKEKVVGVLVDGVAKAYPESAFIEGEGNAVTDSIAGKTFTVAYAAEHRSLRLEHADPGVTWVYAFWFAWSAFKPETTIYQPAGVATSMAMPADRASAVIRTERPHAEPEGTRARAWPPGIGGVNKRRP